MKTSEQNIPIFVISLRRARERREQVMAHLDALGLDYEIVDAVDGAAMSEAERVEVLALGRSYHPGVIGCYVSHINVYRLIVERSLPIALILEDDARLKPAFVPAIQQGLADDSFDLLLLDCAGDTEGTLVFVDLETERPVFGSFHSYEPSLPPAGLYAYIVTLHGARRRLSQAYPIEAPVDVHTRLSYRPDVRVLYRPKGAGLSALDRNSSTSTRLGSTALWYKSLRNLPVYRLLRHWIRLLRVAGISERRRLIKAGVLSPQGKWRQLPAREWIL